MKRLVLMLLLGGCGGTQVNGSAPPPKKVQEIAEEKKAPPIPQPHFVEGEGRLVAVPIDGAVGVAFRVLFYTGSIDDPRGKEGLTMLTARLMTEGGTKKMTYAEILRALYPMAASISVQVDKEQTVFMGTAHPDHVDAYVGMLTDVVKSPRLAKADFERVKTNLINDITKRLRATDDENFGKELLSQMLYRGEHPYRHYVGGTVKGLEAITLEDVKAHAAKVFGRKRLVIGLAGAVTPAVQTKVKAAFADLPEGAARMPEIMAPAIPEVNEVLIAEKPTAQAVAVSIGYPHFATRGHEDWPALALIQSYFGEHRQFHGVLMQEIRGKRGMNYGDYAYVENFIQEGWGRFVKPNIGRRRQHFEIWIRPVKPEETIFAIRMALMQLDTLVRRGVTDEAVDGTRAFLDGYTRLWEMTPSRRLGYALDDDFYGTSKYLGSLREKFGALDGGRVNASIRKHLVPGPVKIAIVGPNAQQIVEGLTSGRPSPKTYEVEKPKEVLALDKVVAEWPLAIAPENVTVIPADQAFVK